MFDRQYIKASGKLRFKQNQWPSVLVALILIFVGGSGFNFGGSAGGSQDTQEMMNDGSGYMSDSQFYMMMAAISGIIIVASLFYIVLRIFVLLPIYQGCRRFFYMNLFFKANLNELGYAFHTNYKNVVKVHFMKNLFLTLWTLLFIIPGIYKAYCYRMVDYLLCENPNMSYKEAIDISQAMMKGRKWDTFVYDLSYIGWYLLSMITCGIVWILWAGPYKANADALLFMDFKTKGFVTPEPAKEGEYAYRENDKFNEW